MAPELELIKDFVDEHIVLFWQSQDAERLSPYFNSVEAAQAWWVVCCTNQYAGEERRSSVVDRRSLDYSRLNRARSQHVPSPQPDGRRETDTPPGITKDRSRVSLLQYYSRNPELLQRNYEVDGELLFGVVRHGRQKGD